MELKDLLITPIFIAIVYALAYAWRPYCTDQYNRRYFFPALSLKIFGAIALGAIYQFYYGGGDTFTYFNLGSKYIWEAFQENPALGIKLIFADGEYHADTFKYASRIYTYGDSASYFVVRLAGLFDILTFHTYSSTAVLFAAVSFTGLWVLYTVFYEHYPYLHKEFAIALFFVPSLFFWGSGLLKDPITLSSLGWLTYSVYQLFIRKNKSTMAIVSFIVSFYVLSVVKVYILLCFIPAALIWVFFKPLQKVKSRAIKLLVVPVLFMITGTSAYYAIKKVGEEDPRYNLETMSHTAEETAKWIHYVSERSGGSSYTLGDFDYSPAGMVQKFPLAVWVTLYRPYLWESKNIVMLLSAFESFALLLFSLSIIFSTKSSVALKQQLSNPLLLMCLVFTIGFSFAVGISTYNFGSLVRYKIPMLPYFISLLFILKFYQNIAKNESLQASTE